MSRNKTSSAPLAGESDKPVMAPVAPVAYSISQAVAATGLSRSNLYVALGAGELLARKRGKRTVILAEDLRRFISSLPAFDADAAATPPERM